MSFESFAIEDIVRVIKPFISGRIHSPELGSIGKITGYSDDGFFFVKFENFQDVVGQTWRARSIMFYPHEIVLVNRILYIPEVISIRQFLNDKVMANITNPSNYKLFVKDGEGEYSVFFTETLNAIRKLAYNMANEGYSVLFCVKNDNRVVSLEHKKNVKIKAKTNKDTTIGEKIVKSVRNRLEAVPKF